MNSSSITSRPDHCSFQVFFLYITDFKSKLIDIMHEDFSRQIYYIEDTGHQKTWLLRFLLGHAQNKPAQLEN